MHEIGFLDATGDRAVRRIDAPEKQPRRILADHERFGRDRCEARHHEVRLRDIPFWFCFAALGALVGTFSTRFVVSAMTPAIACAALATYFIYASVRLFSIGDAADYDSVAFFGYAASFCVLLFAIYPRLPFLAAVGSGSYFIYLWHIFVVMALRDHTSLHVASFAFVYTMTVIVSVAALLTIRWVAPSGIIRWLGA